jgi:hypothetical protein
MVNKESPLLGGDLGVGFEWHGLAQKNLLNGINLTLYFGLNKGQNTE